MIRLYSLLDRPGLLRGLFVLQLLAVLAFAALLPPGHDYKDYLTQWTDMLAGGDPWVRADWPPNNYGPLHILFAPGVLVHPAFNRVLFALVWLGLSVFSWRLILNEKERGDHFSPPWRLVWLVLWFANPFFWVFTLAFGTNDILVAASCLFALHWMRVNRPVPAVLVLAAGALLKLIPGFLLPLLVLPSGFMLSAFPLGWLRRMNWRLFGIFTGATLLGFAAAYGIWGDSALTPFLFGASRGSTMLSIFRFLRGTVSPLGLFMSEPNVDFLGMPLLFGSYLVVLLLYGIGRLERGAASAAALLAVFLFYKVGHHQFYAPLFFLVPLAVFTDRFAADGRRARTFLFYGALSLAWMSFMVLVYLPFRYRNEQFAWLVEYLGLPAFLVGMVSLAGMIHAGRTRAGSSPA